MNSNDQVNNFTNTNMSNATKVKKLIKKMKIIWYKLIWLQNTINNIFYQIVKYWHIILSNFFKQKLLTIQHFYKYTIRVNKKKKCHAASL